MHTKWCEKKEPIQVIVSDEDLSHNQWIGGIVQKVGNTKPEYDARLFLARLFLILI